MINQEYDKAAEVTINLTLEDAESQVNFLNNNNFSNFHTCEFYCPPPFSKFNTCQYIC